MREISGELVVGLWAHLAAHYGTTTIAKEHSPVMRAVGGVLQISGILDRRRFMDGFTTVLGRRIYAPFTPGGTQTSLVGQLDTCIHEHQHVVQLIRDGRARFWGRYVSSSRARAEYEAEAYTTGLELHWWLSRSLPEPKRVAQVLHSYGCAAVDIDRAAATLEANAERIRAGEGITESFAVARAWLEAQPTGELR